MLLAHASVDGLIVRDKMAGQTLSATAHQRQLLEDTAGWLARIGVPDDGSPKSLPMKMLFALFAAAMIRPSHPRSQEMWASTPELLAAKVLAGVDGMLRATEAPPVPIASGPPLMWRRVAIVITVGGAAMATLALVGVLIWAEGRGYRIGGLLFEGDNPYRGFSRFAGSALRSLFWWGLVAGVGAGCAALLWRPVERVVKWVRSG
ncbi:hypothetical protein [Azospirillum argentinense]